jgi:hypothetical protein
MVLGAVSMATLVVLALWRIRAVQRAAWDP